MNEQVKNNELVNYKKKMYLVYVIADVLALIGGIVYFKTENSVMLISGNLLLMAGLVGMLYGHKLRFSKKYSKLMEKHGYHESGFSNAMLETVQLFGIITAILIVLLAVGVIGFGLFLVFIVTHSIIKTILCMIAFDLVYGLKEYFAVAKDK